MIEHRVVVPDSLVSDNSDVESVGNANDRGLVCGLARSLSVHPFFV
jgi:hypothetical protein